MYSDDHCPSGQVISLANRWKKYIDNITPPEVRPNHKSEKYCPKYTSKTQKYNYFCACVKV